MIKNITLIALFVCAAWFAPSMAQVPVQELTSPYKKVSCTDEVTAESVADAAEYAFTGRVIKREDEYVWFRTYVVHKGKFSGDIVKALGFSASRTLDAPTGPIYEDGQVYTVAVRPLSAAERKRHGGDVYMNALDGCPESVFSRAHTRYGALRVEPEQMKDSGLSNLFAGLYLNASALVLLLLVAVGGFAAYLKRDQLRAYLAGENKDG